MSHRGRFLAPVLTLAFLLVPLRAGAAGPASGLPAPSGFTITAPGSTRTIAEGGWINTRQATVHVLAPNNTAGLTPQLELEPAGTAFTGEANYSGTKTNASGQADVALDGLTDGTTYHWQLRFSDANGNLGPWASPAGSAAFDFGVDQDPPTRPVIKSGNAPNQNRWYNDRVINLSWTAHDAASGVQGYSYVIERQAHVIPPGSLVTSSFLHLPDLGNGTWFLALRAEDNAGNWSPTATFRLQIDRVAPRLHWLTPVEGVFNPYKGPVTVRFSFDKDTSARAALYRVGSKTAAATYTYPHLRANQIVSITWNGMTGKDRFARRGFYFFSVRAVDHANNVLRANAGGMAVDPARPGVTIASIKLYPDDGKRVIVSLSQQRLWASQGDRIVLTTLVTTGNPDLPTPTGTYHIMEKLHPFEFISPWPVGSPYYYAPSWTQYAMLFREGGYFLHDAPWRSVFGPGSNGPGQPGTNYGGTHGCVNMPFSAAQFLFGWAPVGTEVDVVP